MVPWAEIGMAALGLVMHFLKDMVQHRADDVTMTPVAYWRDHPYQTALAACGVVAGFVSLLETGQLSLITAFGVGYMANSAADIVGARR